MTHGVRLYLVGSFVLVSLAGCGRGFFSAEREPWRAEAEIACLKSGAVKESADVVRISPISGPGVCGADFPLKVAALGEGSGSFGFADEDLRPPANIGNQPRWPVSPPPQGAPPASSYPDYSQRQPSYGASQGGPISLTAPGVAPDEGEIDLPPEGTPGMNQPPAQRPHQGQYQGSYQRPYPDAQSYPQRDRYSAPYSSRPDAAPAQPQAETLPRLGPAQQNFSSWAGNLRRRRKLDVYRTFGGANFRGSARVCPSAANTTGSARYAGTLGKRTKPDVVRGSPAPSNQITTLHNIRVDCHGSAPGIATIDCSHDVGGQRYACLGRSVCAHSVVE